jgi:hypothetical protein
MRQHTSWSRRWFVTTCTWSTSSARAFQAYTSIRQHTSAYVTVDKALVRDNLHAVYDELHVHFELSIRRSEGAEKKKCITRRYLASPTSVFLLEHNKALVKQLK